MYRRACLLTAVSISAIMLPKRLAFLRSIDCAQLELRSFIPLDFILGEDLPFRVIANNLDIDKAPNIELFRPEVRHDDKRRENLKVCGVLSLLRRNLECLIS